MMSLTLGHLSAEIRNEYYEEEMTFPKFKARLPLTPGRLDDDVGTFIMSTCLFSDRENRYLTHEERLEIIEAMVEKDFGYRLDVVLKASIKGKGCLGKAHYKTCVIEFNVDYMLQDWQDCLENTLYHEYCHLLDYRVHGFSSVHGNNWASLMFYMGKEPSRTYTPTGTLDFEHGSISTISYT